MSISREKTLQITRDIEAWFGSNARDFPWRITSTPWGRLVSEFMAQQTQITRVAQRWPLMMNQFPTPASMAEQDIQAILSIWQGLGYYRRASYLKKSAEMIMEEFGGEVPNSIESLLLLSGIGKYTAGAIASIAFSKRAPIVDGNVHRVLCRLANQVDTPAPCAWSWDVAEKLVQVCKKPGTFNEGLMELGAIICTPKSPKCDKCPIRTHCLACQYGSQHEVPQPKKSKPRKRIHHHAVVLTCGDEIAFEQRAKDGLWAEMWQVPTVESSRQIAVSRIANELGIQDSLNLLGSFEHTLTHRIVVFRVYTCEIERDARYTWYSIDALSDLPLASAQRKVLAVHCPA